jgi:hypothetical protein
VDLWEVERRIRTKNFSPCHLYFVVNHMGLILGHKTSQEYSLVVVMSRLESEVAGLDAYLIQLYFPTE